MNTIKQIVLLLLVTLILGVIGVCVNHFVAERDVVRSTWYNNQHRKVMKILILLITAIAFPFFLLFVLESVDKVKHERVLYSIQRERMRDKCDAMLAQCDRIQSNIDGARINFSNAFAATDGFYSPTNTQIDAVNIEVSNMLCQMNFMTDYDKATNDMAKIRSLYASIGYDIDRPIRCPDITALSNVTLLAHSWQSCVSYTGSFPQLLSPYAKAALSNVASLNVE